MRDEEKTIQIARLNDLARKNPPAANATVVLTPALKAELEKLDDWQSKLVNELSLFDSFTTGNDPYGERDMGKFKIECCEVMFKIDYYDLDMKFHSEAAWDAAKTKRIVTLMTPSDY